MSNTLVSVRTDLSVLPVGTPATRYVLVTLTAPEAPRRKGRQPVDVAFVLDRSGSMGGGKIRLAREAIRQALGMLRHDDGFSLVVYDDEVDLLVPAAPASPEARRNALKRLADVEARGSTDLAGGWMAGCRALGAADPPSAEGEATGKAFSRRCLLLTDGLANVGITDADELATRAGATRRQHIVTSTFGVGADFDEVLLQRMADEGGGHFYFIETPAQITDLLTSELGEALEVVARGASLALQLPTGVRAVPLTRLEHCVTDGGIRIGLGDLVSGQEVQVVIRLDFPARADGQSMTVRFVAADRDGGLAVAPHGVTWTALAVPRTLRPRRDRVVDRAVAGLYAAKARHEAVAMNRAGAFDQARALLVATAARIRSYAGHDPQLIAIARRLVEETEQFGAAMDALSQKAVHFAAYAVMRSRTADGKAQRRPPRGETQS